MEYNMGNDRLSDRTGATLQYQCEQAPGSTSVSNNLPSLIRDSQRYDPVRESRDWYQSNFHSPIIPQSYAIQSNHSSWTQPSNVSMQNQSYPVYSEIMPSPIQSQDSFSNRNTRTFLDMPWNEAHGFGLNIYANQTSMSGGVGELRMTRSTRQLLPITSASPRNLESIPSSYQSTTPPSLPPTSHGNESLAAASETATTAVAAPAPARYIRTHSNELSVPEPRNTGEPWSPLNSLAQANMNTQVSTMQENSTNDSTESLTTAQLISSYLQRRDRNRVDDSEEYNDPQNNTYIEVQRRQTEFMFGSESIEGERSLAALRGALASGKRVPSREAMASIELVSLDELEEDNPTCIICYNKFGVKNPEGIVEIPLRLPKCKHVFGDKCIKKWFEDSDSCPYCRDKLPSELFVKKSLAQESFSATRDRMNALSQRARQSFPSRHFSSEELATRRSSNLARSTGPRTNEENEYVVNRDMTLGAIPASRSSTVDSPERRRQARTRIGNVGLIRQLSRPSSTRVVTFDSQIPPYVGATTEVSGTSNNDMSGSTRGVSVSSRNIGGSLSSTQPLPLPAWPSIEYSVSRSSPENISPIALGFAVNETRQIQFERLNDVRNEMHRSIDDVTNSFFSDLNANPVVLSVGRQFDFHPQGQHPISNDSRTFSTTLSSFHPIESIHQSDIGYTGDGTLSETRAHQFQHSARWSR